MFSLRRKCPIQAACNLEGFREILCEGSGIRKSDKTFVALKGEFGAEIGTVRWLSDHALAADRHEVVFVISWLISC